MRHALVSVLLAYAAAIAACSATPANPPSPPAPAAAAPTQPTAAPAPVVAAPVVVAPVVAAKATTLKAAMNGMEEAWKLIEKALAANPPTNLPAVANAAVEVAGVMRLAHAEFEDKAVPNFATLAREAEAAFLDLSKKASLGDGPGVKAHEKTLQPQHCARCHDAVEAVHG